MIPSLGVDVIGGLSGILTKIILIHAKKARRPDEEQIKIKNGNEKLPAPVLKPGLK